MIAQGRPSAQIQGRWRAYVHGQGRALTDSDVNALVKQVLANARQENARAVQYRQTELATLRRVQHTGQTELARVKKLQRQKGRSLRDARLRRKIFVAQRNVRRNSARSVRAETSATSGRVRLPDTRLRKASRLRRRRN